MKKITFVGVRTGDKVSWAEGYSPRHGDSIMVNRDGQMIAAGTVNITSPDSIVNPVDWHAPVGYSQEPLYALTELGAPEPKTSTEHSDSTHEYECIGMWSRRWQSILWREQPRSLPLSSWTRIFDSAHNPVGYANSKVMVWCLNRKPIGDEWLYIQVNNPAEKAPAEKSSSGEKGFALLNDERFTSLKPSPEPTLYAPYILDVLDELHRAQTKFPTWPTDPLHALAVLGEEFGELTQAMLELKNEPEKPRATIEHVRTEAIQTAAMALRLLKNMDRYDFTKK